MEFDEWSTVSAPLTDSPCGCPSPPPNVTAVVNFASLPNIFTVLGKLGLELHRQEEILPVYTVERIERPAAN